MRILRLSISAGGNRMGNWGDRSGELEMMVVRLGFVAFDS